MKDILELACKPVCTLTTLEYLAFATYCASHADEANELVRTRFPEVKELFVAHKPKESGCDTSRRYVYGLQGIRKLFDCSTPTAARIHKSGVIDRAISMVGRKIVVDADLALDLVRESGSFRVGRK